MRVCVDVVSNAFHQSALSLCASRNGVVGESVGVLCAEKVHQLDGVEHLSVSCRQGELSRVVCVVEDWQDFVS